VRTVGQVVLLARTLLRCTHSIVLMLSNEQIVVG
jgi:hypothetical protein